MFPHGVAAEAPKDQVTIRVVPGFPDRHIPEEAKVFKYYIKSRVFVDCYYVCILNMFKINFI